MVASQIRSARATLLAAAALAAATKRTARQEVKGPVHPVLLVFLCFW